MFLFQFLENSALKIENGDHRATSPLLVKEISVTYCKGEGTFYSFTQSQKLEETASVNSHNFSIKSIMIQNVGGVKLDHN